MIGIPKVPKPNKPKDIHLVALAPVFKKVDRKVANAGILQQQTNFDTQQFGCRRGCQPIALVLRVVFGSVAKKWPVYCIKFGFNVAFDSTSQLAVLSTLGQCGAPDWLTHTVLKSYIKIEVQATIASDKKCEVHACTPQDRGVRVGFAESFFFFFLCCMVPALTLR